MAANVSTSGGGMTVRAPLPQMIDRYGESIQSALRAELSKDGSFVYDILRYYMGWADETGAPQIGVAGSGAGKAVRPTLCLFGCEAVGGEVAQAIPAAVALELIHNFSLIHDDIQDKDETRRGRKTVWAVWGLPKALVAGNVLRVVADSALHNLPKSERAIAAVSLLTEAYLEMIDGQYLDISFEGRHDIGMDDYRRMISRKTGALLRCSLNMGATVGTDDASTVAAFRECGRALGYVFQIRDDALGVWGEESVTGKPVGSDIRRKKNSYPVVYAMENADALDGRLLSEIYAKDALDDADVASVMGVMERIGVQERAHVEASEWADMAMAALVAVELSPEARRDIEDFTHFLLVRDR